MKLFVFAAAAMALTVGAAQAQSGDKSSDPKQHSPGTVGAMDKATPDGVATSPGAVAAQQGSAAKHSPGTVGAAPGANTPSQKP